VFHFLVREHSIDLRTDLKEVISDETLVDMGVYSRSMYLETFEVILRNQLSKSSVYTATE
jgi:hypothetical protein